MKRLMGDHGKLFSRSTAAGLVLLLVLAGWTPAAGHNVVAGMRMNFGF